MSISTVQYDRLKLYTPNLTQGWDPDLSTKKVFGGAQTLACAHCLLSPVRLKNGGRIAPLGESR